LEVKSWQETQSIYSTAAARNSNIWCIFLTTIKQDILWFLPVSRYSLSLRLIFFYFLLLFLFVKSFLLHPFLSAIYFFRRRRRRRGATICRLTMKREREREKKFCGIFPLWHCDDNWRKGIQMMLLKWLLASWLDFGVMGWMVSHSEIKECP
jgi:hypothetical protein